MSVRPATIVLAAILVAASTLLLYGCGGHPLVRNLPTVRPPAHSSAANHRLQTSQPAKQALLTYEHDARRATAALAAFTRSFFVANHGRAYFQRTSAGSQATFWAEAEMIEMVEDASQTTGKPLYKHMLTALMTGFRTEYGSNWTAIRPYNDDVLWMVIAAVRAYTITGDIAYRDLAKFNYDRVYSRSWSPALGGGLWWTTQQTAKNTTTAAPAIIAACELYETLHQASYLSQATSLFAWLSDHLFDAHSGAVYDGIGYTGGGTLVSRASYTYNQGTFIGAASLLYRLTGKKLYCNDALAALSYTKARLTSKGTLKSEGSPNGNRGGFKGIFIRWATLFVAENHITSYSAWFQQNAKVAWSHRNRSSLIGDDWSKPTPNGELASFPCSSAVVLFEAVLALQPR
ncbi:MAG: glycoside hydrolase family 76 protein [Thermoleophilia bacterium]